MRRDDLVEAIRRSPFRPFRLHVSDGGTFDIRHPETLMVTRHSAVVGMQEDGGADQHGADYPAIDRYTVVDLLHITRLEQLSQPGTHPT